MPKHHTTVEPRFWVLPKTEPNITSILIRFKSRSSIGSNNAAEPRETDSALPLLPK